MAGLDDWIRVIDWLRTALVVVLAVAGVESRIGTVSL